MRHFIKGSQSASMHTLTHSISWFAFLGEKTMLKIHKLSTQYVSAQEGGELNIFTSEDGPPITAGKFFHLMINFLK